MEDVVPESPVLRWLQEEVRSGPLAKSVERFVSTVPESVDPQRVQVTAVYPDRLDCRIPYAVIDHESPHPFRTEITFSLNPLTGQVFGR